MVGIVELRALYPRASEARLEAFAEQSDACFRDYGLDANDNRLHFFLAQVGHESDGLTITEENLNYRAERIVAVWPKRFADVTAARACAGDPQRLANTVYCDRMGNGPFESGDGWLYRGRGYIQITGREGYDKVGAIAGLDLVGSPELAHDPEHALRVGCAFWQWKSLNAICDTGDFARVTRRINGGEIGMTDRRAWLDKVRRTFAVPPPLAQQPSAAEIIAVQRALQRRGYRELGAADGVIGPRTLAAITRFRQEKRLPLGGIDQALKAALEIEA
jgi:putative chitinase